MINSPFAQHLSRCRANPKSPLGLIRRGLDQRGIALILSLLLLVLISMTAVVAVRSATSSEITTNSARKNALALQAAEAGLAFCEDQARTNSALVNPPTIAWSDTSVWDSSSPSFTRLTLPNLGSELQFKRMPECVVHLRDASVPGVVVITARGFGPEVPAGSGAPVGTEVWLQAIVSLN